MLDPGSNLDVAFRAPPGPRPHVSRPELVARLDASAARLLTVVCAPAGWGKSALVAEWARSRDHNVSWLGFGPDDDPVAVARRIISAMGALGAAEDGVARTGGLRLGPELRDVMTEWTRSLPECFLVLEGADHLDSPLREQLGLLIQAASGPVHFVVTTRSDVLFPATMKRLRRRGEVEYLYPEDLAFDRESAKQLLERVSQRSVGPHDVGTLLERTGGWPAAVRYAATAIRSAADPAGALRNFGADDQGLRDFFRAEIATPQPDPIRRFLIEMSVPDRFDASLCRAFTGRSDSSEMLSLVQRKGFVEPVDGADGWWRYRPLLRDLFLAELGAVDRRAEQRLRNVAAEWRLKNGTLAAVPAAVDEPHLPLVLEPRDSVVLADVDVPGRAKTMATVAHARSVWQLGNASAAMRALRLELASEDASALSRLHALGGLAEIESWDGSLTGAVGHVDEAHRIASTVLTPEHPYLVATESAHAHVLIERMQLQPARLALERAEYLARLLGLEGFVVSHAIEHAWLDLASGAARPALEHLDERMSAAGDIPPRLDARYRALAARAHLAMGDRAVAEGLLFAEDTPEWEVVAARVQVALGDRDVTRARADFAGWAHRAEFQEQLSYDLWSAVILFVEGDLEAALDTGDRVVAQAENEGHVRLFLDSGPDVRRLLVALAQRRPESYAKLVLGAADAGPVLSAREQGVLVCLAARLTYAEISERLFISRNTVKSHAQSIYMKLGVSGRREATARAEELGLL